MKTIDTSDFKFTMPTKEEMLDEQNEAPIKKIKDFYKKHLMTLRPTKELLDGIENLCVEFKKESKNGEAPFMTNTTRVYLLEKAEEFLKLHFPPSVKTEFSKEVPRLSLPKIPSSNAAGRAVQFLKKISDDKQHAFCGKADFLYTLRDSIQSNGLHHNIFKRVPAKYQRFNIQVKHNYQSPKRSQKVCRLLLSKEELENEFRRPYFNKKPIKFGGKFIPFDNVLEVVITTTLLRDDEIELFALQKKFKWNTRNKDSNTYFLHCCVDVTQKYLPNPHDSILTTKNIDYHLVETNNNWLKPFPGALKLYNSAFLKLNESVEYRGAIDDLRLCFEMLLKLVLKNSKSLENQKQDLGRFLEAKGMSLELRNMFIALVSHYASYQNEHVKHNDKIENRDVAFLIDQTSLFMKHLLME